METLRTFYTRLFKSLVVGAVAVVVFARTQQWPGWTISGILLAATSVLGLARSYGWKLAYPKLDLAGVWVGETTYVTAHPMRPAEDADSKAGTTALHEVRIYQDCFSVRIEPSVSDDFIEWSSHAADIDNRGRLHYAYEVRYQPDRWPPREAKGYEVLAATTKGRRGRPEGLTGTFSQCVQEVGPVYSGAVRFERQHDGFKVKIGKAWRWVVAGPGRLVAGARGAVESLRRRQGGKP